MNYNFIQIKPRGHLLTILDSSNKARYICFNTKMDAAHCISYVSKFRSENGYFPMIDFSNTEEKQEIKSAVFHKKRNPNDISKFMSILTMNSRELDYLCSMNNIDIFYVYEFSYAFDENNQMQLLLSAQELNSNPDYLKYVNNMNNMFYKSQ